MNTALSFRLRFTFPILAGLLLGFPFAQLSIADTADPEVSVGRAEAHDFMLRGDQARDRRQWAEAIRSYQAALEMFRMLRGEAPRWEQDYFDFRKDYCRREIRLIEQQTGRSAEAWLEEETTLQAADAERYRLLYHTMRRENERLREKILELEDDLELMLEMEELERQREQAQRRREITPMLDEEPLPIIGHSEPQPVVVQPPPPPRTRVPPPEPARDESGLFRRRQPRQTGLRR